MPVNLRKAVLSALLLMAQAVLIQVTMGQVTMASAEVLNRGNGDEPSTLDPQKTTMLVENVITGDLFMGLTTEDAAGALIPGAAESWTISDDGLTYIFRLRAGLSWSDGAPFRAADFVYSFRRMLDAETASGNASNLFLIENGRDITRGEKPLTALGVRAPDDVTLVIKLERPAPYFLKVLSYLYPVPKHVIDIHGSTWQRPATMVTNGAYRLTDWRPNEYVRADRNEHFFDAENVAIETIYFYTTENLHTALNRFRAGELDITFGIPSERVDWVRENLPDSFHITPTLGLVYTKINFANPALQDVRVRRALALGVDREVLTDRLLRTGAKPAWHIVPSEVTDFPQIMSSDMALSDASRLELAVQLMNDAGFSGEARLELTLRFWSSNDIRKVAVALQAMWRPIGVNIVLHNAESKVHFSDLAKGDFDLGMSGWTSFDDPAEFLDVIYSKSPNNNGGYHSEAFDEMFETARLTADAAERAKILAAAEALAMSEYPVIPLYFQVRHHLVSSAVNGWVDGAASNHRSRFLSISRD